MTATHLNAVDVVIGALVAQGIDAVDEYDPTALSAPGRVIVTEGVSPSIPHINYASRPNLRITVWSVDGWRAARALAFRCLVLLEEAREAGSSKEFGGIHRVIPVTAPARADLTGAPFGVGRVTCFFDLVLATAEKWQ